VSVSVSVSVCVCVFVSDTCGCVGGACRLKIFFCSFHVKRGASNAAN
jgi:hypothetical protein